MRHLCLMLAVAFTFALPSIATAKKKKTQEDHIKHFKSSLDIDKDGKLTKKEWDIHAKKKYRDHEASYEKYFKKWDTDKDDILTAEEFAAGKMSGAKKKEDKKSSK